jgi:hypothetical protein
LDGNLVVFIFDAVDGLAYHNRRRVGGDLDLGLLVFQHHLAGLLDGKCLYSAGVAHRKNNQGDEQQQDGDIDDVHAAFYAQTFQHSSPPEKVVKADSDRTAENRYSTNIVNELKNLSLWIP